MFCRCLTSVFLSLSSSAEVSFVYMNCVCFIFFLIGSRWCALHYYQNRKRGKKQKRKIRRNTHLKRNHKRKNETTNELWRWTNHLYIWNVIIEIFETFHCVFIILLKSILFDSSHFHFFYLLSSKKKSYPFDFRHSSVLLLKPIIVEISVFNVRVCFYFTIACHNYLNTKID